MPELDRTARLWDLATGQEVRRFVVPDLPVVALADVLWTLCPQRSAIEIASGRLFAGRPPAWTLPRRPHRRSPGAKRPLRRGFNRVPELDRTVQRLKSPLEGFSPGVHLRGRCHGDRIGGRPARSVLLAVSTACLSLTAQRGCGIRRPGRRCGGSLFPTSRWWRLQTCYGRYVLSVQRLKSPLEGFSPGVHLRGRCRSDRIGGRPARSTVQRLKSPLEGFSPGVHLRGRRHGDRIGGRPARSVLLGAVSTACLSSYLSGSLDRTVQRLKSPLEGFSPGVHLRGRCHGDRIGGRPARSVLLAVYGL
jgi:hypothetical protein